MSIGTDDHARIDTPRRWNASRRWRIVATALIVPMLSSCVSLTALPRAVILDGDRNIRVSSLPCSTAAAAPKPTAPTAGGLDPRAIRLVSWNIHKQSDRGWQEDLARFARANDLVLLQEATLDPMLRATLDDAGLSWVMASSFLYGDIDIGVMTATRTAPVATCTERAMEPLLRIPKSAVVTWFALEGDPRTLAVVNLHAINFSLTLGAYREQFVALTHALAQHDGPMIVAGDFNTWNDARQDAVREAATTLQLLPVTPTDDRRSLFMGRQLDHVLVRGLDVVESTAIPVTSSDHNPVQATLRLRRDGL